VKRLLSDTMVVTERNLIRLARAPEVLLAFTVQPIMFVLLFRYVFGGAVRVPGSSYVEFLIPGIAVQTIAFGGFVTAIGLNEDMRKGLIDRFRSLPMTRAAVLAGRTSADLVSSALALTILILTGLIIGFSFQTSPLHVIIGLVLALTFGYALLWACAFLGLLVKTPEAANAVGFFVVFPVTFISSAFVPVQTLPTPLRQLAEVNPFTIVVNELRWLWTGLPSPDELWQAFAWVGVILVVFSSLAVQRYGRTATRDRRRRTRP
jgi:ABC-2 type transport system permease protein